MRFRSFLVALLTSLTFTPAYAVTTQAVKQGRIQYALTQGAHMAPSQAKVLQDVLAQVRPYDTVAELLAATPTAGTIGYAIDSSTFYLYDTAWHVWSAVITPTVYTLDTTLLSASPADGTVAYSQDADKTHFRTNGTWYPILGQYILTMGNAGTLSNATDGAWIMGEGGEDLKFAFTTDAVTLSSSTGLNSFSFGTIVPTVPSLTSSGSLTLASGDVLSDGTAGKFTLTGTGGATNKEALSLDMETVANTVTLSSTTGVTRVDGTSSIDFAGKAFVVETAKGAQHSIVQATQSITFPGTPGAASEITSGLIPAGSTLEGTSYRVTTAGTNCASWNAGDGSTADLYVAAGAVTLHTTKKMSDAKNTTAYPTFSPSAREVTITGVSANCFGLVVAITATYRTNSAATAD